MLNEPETSLNESVFPALCQVRVQELTMRFGDTRLRGQENAKACYVFDDDDDEQEASPS